MDETPRPNQTDLPSQGTSSEQFIPTKRIKLGPNSEMTTSVSNSYDLKSWQETKVTIKERTSCLVNSERLSDVTFLVGQNETPILGHKTVLSMGSPYFEKMFYGPLASPGTDTQIKIPDIEPEVFLTFLKYLYTDEFDASMDDVDTMLLLKPAKVYIVPHLAEKCTELLVERLSPDNIIEVLRSARVFDEVRLAEFCLRFLDRQIDKVIASENFMEIDQETLCTLLERDNLRVDECALFKAVYKWGKSECLRRGIEETISNQREVLGRAISLIRFPTMTKEEFSVEVVPTDILEKDEVIGIFMNLCIETPTFKQFKPATSFSTEKRVFKPKLHYLNRFADILSKVLNISIGSNDLLYSSKLKMRVDQRIFIHGLGLYGILSPTASLRFNATASVGKGETIFVSKQLDGNGRTYDFRMPFQVMFDKPIEISPDEEYSLKAVLKVVRSPAVLCGGFLGNPNGHLMGGSVNIDSYYGTKGQPHVKMNCMDGVVVNFDFILPTIYHVGSHEAFTHGQLPQIIYSV